MFNVCMNELQVVFGLLVFGQASRLISSTVGFVSTATAARDQ